MSARRAAEISGSDNLSRIPWEITGKTDIVFITTPDSVIADTYNSISLHSGFCKNVVALHCSEALPSTILASVKECGGFAGSMHPLQSFALVEIEKNPFQDIIISMKVKRKLPVTNIK